MSLNSIQSVTNTVSNVLNRNQFQNISVDKFVDLSDPNDGKQLSYDELVILSNPKKSTQYILDNSFTDYSKQIKAGNILKSTPHIPIKEIIIYSNPITTSYEINKMAKDGRLSQQDAERLNNTLIKNSIGYGLNIL